MAELSPYGKLIAGFLFSDDAVLKSALDDFSTAFSPAQRHSSIHSFEETNYYAPEMGTGLKRQFFSFSGVISLENLPHWKHTARLVEDSWQEQGKRRVNIDPGYLDFHKVILLSSKPGAQKIYMGHQVWADMVLLKCKGGYQTFAWTFPDLRDHKYDSFFLEARQDFKKERKQS